MPCDAIWRGCPYVTHCLMGTLSKLINRDVPEFQRVIIWTQMKLELTDELSMEIEFATQIKSVTALGQSGN